MSTSPASLSETRLSAGDAVLSAIGAMLLIISEMAGAAFALAWAIGGLLGASHTVIYGLSAVIAVPGFYVAFLLVRRILKVEARLRAQAVEE